MKVITAPNSYYWSPGEVTVFLAGGIQNTENWQNIVIDKLALEFTSSPLVVFNPRRDNYPTHNPDAALEQIKWEFDRIEMCDIFSMYFASGNTDQPICMFEYSKQLVVRGMHGDLSRLVVSVNPDYRRKQDVLIQTRLAQPCVNINLSLDAHIDRLIDVIRNEFLLKST